MDDIFDKRASDKLLKEHRAILDKWIENAFRRDEVINRNVPYCPHCGTRQVQIKNKSIPAQWKCRMCKWWFEYEGDR